VSRQHFGREFTNVAGPAEKVYDMVAACRRGSPDARVDGIIAAPVEDDGAPGFRMLPTV
jgi:hypothetical protein